MFGASSGAAVFAALLGRPESRGRACRRHIVAGRAGYVVDLKAMAAEQAHIDMRWVLAMVLHGAYRLNVEAALSTTR